MERLADGDLIWRMREDDFNGDAAKMPRDFNAAVETLQTTMSSVGSTAGAIRAGADEIGTASG
jgi:methyl-accepting chemotaxis protein